MFKINYASTRIFIVLKVQPYNSLNTSYVSLKRLVRTKFPTGIAQHREIQRTVQITGEIDTEKAGIRKQKGSLATLSTRNQL